MNWEEIIRETVELVYKALMALVAIITLPLWILPFSIVMIRLKIQGELK